MASQTFFGRGAKVSGDVGYALWLPFGVLLFILSTPLWLPLWFVWETLAAVRKARGRPEYEAALERLCRDISQVKAQYPRLLATLCECLYRHDPGPFGYETPKDCVDIVGTMIPRLPTCLSDSDVVDAIHEAFVRWEDPRDVGPKTKLTEVAKEIWTIWSETQRNARPDA